MIRLFVGGLRFSNLEKRKLFICDNCDKGFTQKHNLKSHIFKTCPESNVKPRAPGIQILDFKTDAGELSDVFLVLHFN